MNSTQLQKELNQNILTSLYLFIGEDPYIAQSYVKLIKSRFFTEFPELNVTQFDEKNIDATSVIAACTMLPIMAERRLVIVQAQINKNKELADMLSDYASHPCESTTFILFVSQIDKRTAVYKEFQKAGKVVTFQRLDAKELKQWAQNRFAKSKKHIEADALKYLIDAIDYHNKESEIDLGFFANEIDKLIQFQNQKETITLYDVTKISSVNINQDLFRFTDVLIGGYLSDAYEQLYKIEYNNTPIQLVIGALARTMRNICICQTEQEKGSSEADIAKAFGIHPYVVKKSLQARKTFGINDAKQALVVLQRIDIRIKTGRLEPKQAFSILVEDIGTKKFLLARDYL